MTEKITVVVPCACGETARQELTLDEAQLYAVRMLVMAPDVNVMDLLPVQVGGE